MNWFDLFILFPVGFLLPSFKLYVAVARSHPIDIFLKHFVVMSFFLTASQVIDSIFGDFWLIDTAKICLLWLLLSNHMYGSGVIFDIVFSTIGQITPFLVEFSYNAHSSSISQLLQDLSLHFEESFIRRFHEILDEVDE